MPLRFCFDPYTIPSRLRKELVQLVRGSGGEIDYLLNSQVTHAFAFVYYLQPTSFIRQISSFVLSLKPTFRLIKKLFGTELPS